MRNLSTVIKLEIFIAYIVTHISKYKVPEVKITKLLRDFKRIPEKGGEIFKRPDMIYLMMQGDCDDWTTLISFLAHRKGIKCKHVYLLKNNTPVHIFPILKVNDKWVTCDPWQGRLLKPYKRKKNEREVETCLLINGNKQSLC